MTSHSNSILDWSNIQSNVRDSYILNYLAKLIQSTSPTSRESLAFLLILKPAQRLSLSLANLQLNKVPELPQKKLCDVTLHSLRFLSFKQVNLHLQWNCSGHASPAPKSTQVATAIFIPRTFQHVAFSLS